MKIKFIFVVYFAFVIIFLQLSCNLAVATPVLQDDTLIEEAEKKYEDKKSQILSYKNDFCSMESFASLMIAESEDLYESKIDFPVTNIEMIEKNGDKVCRVAFRCTWCRTDKITTDIYFRRNSLGKLEFDTTQGTDASNTLYFLAVWLERPQSVKELIEKGADVNYKYKDNVDSFFTRNLIGFKYSDIIKVCVENGANIHEQYIIHDGPGSTMYKRTPLGTAVNMNDVDSVALFLERGVDPNVPYITIYPDGTETKSYPIERTISFTDPAMSKLLLQYGAKIPKYGYVDGQKMPLIWAVMLDNPFNLVERLSLWLSHGGDVNAEYRFSRPITIYGSDKKMKRIIPDYKEKKPVDYAEENNMRDVIDILQKFGAHPKHEITNLHWCNTDLGKQICGTFINNTDVPMSAVLITLNLYDAEEARVGETVIMGNNLNSKEKWKFKTTAEIGPEVKSFKIQQVDNLDL